MGTLGVGKRADFIVLNVNPLDDINTAIHDLEGGRLHGRGVIIP